MALWTQKAAFDKLGIKLVAVVKEWIPEEIAAFTEKYWPSDELFLDEEKVLFAAINNGEPLQLAMSTLANPFRSALHVLSLSLFSSSLSLSLSVITAFQYGGAARGSDPC